MVASVGELNRLYAQRASLVNLQWDCLADGDVNSEIAIVSEAPGSRESVMKLPLVGGSGQLLWKALERFGLRRQHVYITNVVKRQLVEAVRGKDGISKNELSHWKALLDWELDQLPRLKYVFVLGGIALEALVGDTGIEKWRGSVVGDGKRKFIITYNPANILRKPNLEPVFMLDCAKLELVRSGKWTEHEIQAHFDPSPKEAIHWCDKMIQEAVPVSVDIETSGGETACVGFANEAHAGMCINFRNRDTNRWTVAEEREVRRAIQRVVRHPRARLVAQNGAFDAAWLWFKDRIKCRPFYVDTLLAHHTLHPIWPHNLGFLTAQYTTHPYYKDDKDEWREGGDISTFWQYNVKDCCITWEVARRLVDELKQQQMWDFFTNHVMRLQPWLVEATVLGNLVDKEMRDKLNADYGLEVTRLANEFKIAARIASGDDTLDCNPNSPKQLGELLFQRLRLVGKNTSTNKENRMAMIENPRTSEEARRMLILLNEYAETHKLYSTYITAAVDEDGRMRSDYKQYGTQNVPGRLSSSQTLWGSGMNLQNQPERLRGMFMADTIEIPV